MNFFQKKINPREFKLSVPLSQDGQDHLLDSNFQSPRNEAKQHFNINAYHEVDQSNISSNVQYSQVNNSVVRSPNLKETADFSKKNNQETKHKPKLEKLFQEDSVEQRGNLNGLEKQQSSVSQPKTEYQNLNNNKKQDIQQKSKNQDLVEQNQMQQKQIENTQNNKIFYQKADNNYVQQQTQKTSNQNQKIQENYQHLDDEKHDQTALKRTKQNYNQPIVQKKNYVVLQSNDYQQANDKQLRSFSLDQNRVQQYRFDQQTTPNFYPQNIQQKNLENTSKKTIVQKKDSFQKSTNNFKELYQGQKLINQQLQQRVKELEEQVKKLQEDKKSIVDGYEKIVANMQNLQKLEKEVYEINEKKKLFSQELNQLTSEPKSVYEIPSQKNSMPSQINQVYPQNDFVPFNKTISYQRSSEYGLQGLNRTTSLYRQPRTKQRISITNNSRDNYQPRVQRVYKTTSYTRLQLKINYISQQFK